MTNYYEVLCIQSDANREGIAAAYRKLALEVHPLKHEKTSFPTNLAKLNSISEAYEVLSEEKFRKIYDKYGYESLKNGIPSGANQFPGYSYKGNSFKIFEAFFGYSNPHCESFEALAPYQVPNEAKADDLQVTLQCTLFEMYNGATKELKYERSTISYDGEVSENK
jgi:DnaJ-class molecular chaperone